MGLGATGKTVKSVYEGLQNAGATMAAIAERYVADIDAGPIAYVMLCDDMIAQLRENLTRMPDASGYAQVWIDRLASYADDQAQSPSADYMADYEAVRVACKAVITEGIALMPVDGDGNLLMRTIDAEGYTTRRTTTQTANLKTLLGNLITVAS